MAQLKGMATSVGGDGHSWMVIIVTVSIWDAGQSYRRDPAIDASHAVTANAFEALSWESLFSGKWKDAIKAAHDWQGLEPFSVRPAVMGSFVAVTHLDEGASAELFCRRGLIANKGNSVLHNNLAVALAIQGRVDDAAAELESVRPPENLPETVINFATQGLIQMQHFRGIGSLRKIDGTGD